jgi:protein-S-isoprenylcysteine O-methyltransferase Ste14
VKIESDSARVKIPPPLFGLSSIALAYALERVAGLPLGLGVAGKALGILLVVSGLGIILWCKTRFDRAGTNIEPWKTTTSLVTGGIYRFSRNPIYTAFLAISLGAGCLLDTGWGLVTTGLLMAILRFQVISLEERYLESKFGQEYAAYKSRVRRWL